MSGSETNSKSSLDSEGEDEKEIKVDRDFSEKIKKYVTIDNEIREHQLKIKELNLIKRQVETYIIKKLGEVDNTIIQINGGTLRLNKISTKETIKPTTVKVAVSDVLKINDDAKIQPIIEKIEELRKTKKNVKLKRAFDK